jgi:RimJ/RimL family protein N-acetyltransferase
MKLVENNESYYEFIRNLRNDQREGFIQQGTISKTSHRLHMIGYSHCYYLCLDDSGEPLGYCGVIDDDIRVAVSSNHQGKGVGAFMINELMKKHPRALAKVKIENEASLALFEKCGFKKKYYILERE